MWGTAEAWAMSGVQQVERSGESGRAYFILTSSRRIAIMFNANIGHSPPC